MHYPNHMTGSAFTGANSRPPVSGSSNRRRTPLSLNRPQYAGGMFGNPGGGGSGDANRSFNRVARVGGAGNLAAFGAGAGFGSFGGGGGGGGGLGGAISGALTAGSLTAGGFGIPLMAVSPWTFAAGAILGGLFG